MKRRYTLSGKLVALFVVIAMLFVVLVGSTIGHSFRHHFKNEVRPHLLHYLEYIQRDIGNPPDRQRAETLAHKLNIQVALIDAEGYWSSHGQHLTPQQVKVHHRFSENGVHYAYGETNDHRQVLVSEVGGSTLIFSLPHIERRGEGRLLLPLGVLLVILFLLYYATRRLFRPIETIRDGVQRFGQGELGHRIDINRRDELGELANSFNTMADDIEQMLEAKRQLLLAISHELRTPMTRAKVSLEFIEDEAQRQELNRDLQEMEHLIEELLETERLATSHRALNLQLYRLNNLIEEVAQHHFADKPLNLSLPEQTIEANVDVTRLKLLVKNLLENALRHTPAGSAASVLTLQKEGTTVELRIQDYGEGVDEQHLAHLTEPFYRADSARQRQTGGYGLGLYLCRVIAEAHGGGLVITSEKGTGTTVTVTLPA